MAENLLELQEIEKTSFHNDDSSITYSLAKRVLHSKNQIMIVTGMKKSTYHCLLGVEGVRLKYRYQ